MKRIFSIIALLLMSLCYSYGARSYNPITLRWTTQDPMAEKYYRYSPYTYCVNNPIRFVDPNGQIIRGATKNDAKKFKNDIFTIINDSKFRELRSRINIKGKEFEKINEQQFYKFLDGQRLTEYEQAYLKHLLFAINTKSVHIVEYNDFDKKELSLKSSSLIAKYINTMQVGLGDFHLTKNGTISTDLIIYLYGGGLTIPTKHGSFSFIVTQSSLSSSDRAILSGHEILGHGIFVSKNELENNIHAVQVENLIRKLLGLPLWDGSNHADGKKITNPYDIPTVE